MAEEQKDGMFIEHGTAIYRHRGVDIRYNENKGTWWAHTLNIEHVNLGVVKDKISELDKTARNAEGTPVIRVRFNSYRLDDTVCLAQTLDVDKPDMIWVLSFKRKHSGRYGDGPVVDIQERDKVDISELILDTPENRAMLEDIKNKSADLHAQIEANRKRLADIPRFVPPARAELVPLTDAQAEKFTASIRKRKPR